MDHDRGIVALRLLYVAVLELLGAVTTMEGVKETLVQLSRPSTVLCIRHPAYFQRSSHQLRYPRTFSFRHRILCLFSCVYTS